MRGPARDLGPPLPGNGPARQDCHLCVEEASCVPYLPSPSSLGCISSAVTSSASCCSASGPLTPSVPLLAYSPCIWASRWASLSSWTALTVTQALAQRVRFLHGCSRAAAWLMMYFRRGGGRGGEGGRSRPEADNVDTAGRGLHQLLGRWHMHWTLTPCSQCMCLLLGRQSSAGASTHHSGHFL